MNPVFNIQEEIAARLNAESYFSDITIITEREADLETAINKALKLVATKDGKIGVAVVVGEFFGDVDSENVPGPHFSQSGTAVTIFENPLFNNGDAGTGKAAVDIAVKVAQVLHHYYAGGIAQTLLVSGKKAVEPLGSLREGETAYRVNVQCPLDAEILDKVLTPTISPAGGAVPQEVTLACATAEASIYYTLDQSYPWSGNANATLYAAPFNVTAAAVLRVVAHKTDLVASDAAFAEFT